MQPGSTSWTTATNGADLQVPGPDLSDTVSTSLPVRKLHIVESSAR